MKHETHETATVSQCTKEKEISFKCFLDTKTLQILSGPKDLRLKNLTRTIKS